MSEHSGNKKSCTTILMFLYEVLWILLFTIGLLLIYCIEVLDPMGCLVPSVVVVADATIEGVAEADSAGEVEEARVHSQGKTWRNQSGISQDYPRLRRTSMSSTQELPTDHQYVLSLFNIDLKSKSVLLDAHN